MKIDKLTSIGESIKAYRKNAKMTQVELAERIDKTESSIRKYEKGIIQPPIDVIERIATTFGITPYELMGATYWDSLHPDISERFAQDDAFKAFIETLNFVVEEVPASGNADEGITSIDYELKRDKKSATLTQAEFDELRNLTKEVIEAKFYKKLLERKK